MPRLLLLLPALLLPLAAQAQRNGDVRNGFDNQPTTGEVRSRERAAGVAPPARVQQQKTDQVDDIYKQLMTTERPGAQGPGQSAVTPLQPAPTEAK